MGGIIQVDTIQNNNTSTLIAQTNTTTITIARSGQTVVIPSGTTFNASSASVNLPAISLTTGVTGTLPYTNGGTGLTTLGTAGQALVVNSGATALQYSTVGATAGQVIQVLSATDSTQRTTTSTPWVTASNTLSVNITPSSASNKILILVTAMGSVPTYSACFTIYKNSTTNLGDTTYGLQQFGGRSNGIAMSWYDSPATTSSVNYQVRISSPYSDTVTLNYGPTPGSIICMEVKG